MQILKLFTFFKKCFCSISPVRQLAEDPVGIHFIRELL